MKKQVQVMSDTCSSLSVAEGKDIGVVINPLYVKLGESMLQDTVEITNEEFYKRIKSEQLVPSTSQPNIDLVSKNYQQHKDKIILNITPSAGLSGTNNGANLAINGQENVHVYDSRTIAAAQRYLVLKAKKLSNEGKGLEEILKELEISKNNTRAFMIPIDYDFLRRGGRLSKNAALLLGLLRIKPILTLSEDRNSVDRYSFSITMKKAIQTCTKAMRKDKVDESYKVYIMHADNISIAKEAEEILLEELGVLDIEVLTLPPVLGCHAGPGTLVIQYIKK